MMDLTDSEIDMLKSLSIRWRFFSPSLISRTIQPGTEIIEGLIAKGLVSPYMRVEAHITDAGRKALEVQA